MGRIGVGRIYNGKIRTGQQVAVIARDGATIKCKVQQVQVFDPYTTALNNDGNKYYVSATGNTGGFSAADMNNLVTVLRYGSLPFPVTEVSNNIVPRLLVDHNGAFWAATNDGLNRFDEVTGRFTTYKAESRRRVDSYLDLVESRRR